MFWELYGARWWTRRGAERISNSAAGGRKTRGWKCEPETMRVQQLHSLTEKALGEGEGAEWQRRGRESPSIAL